MDSKLHFAQFCTEHRSFSMVRCDIIAMDLEMKKYCFYLKWQSDYNNLMRSSKIGKIAMIFHNSQIPDIMSWQSWQKNISVQINAKIPLLSQRFHLALCPHITELSWRWRSSNPEFTQPTAWNQINSDFLELANCTYLLIFVPPNPDAKMSKQLRTWGKRWCIC